MLNKISKGLRAEREAQKILEAKGYQTFKPRRSKFGEKDIFGKFDVIYITFGGVKLIQVKHRFENDTEQGLIDFAKQYKVRTEFWIRQKGKREFVRKNYDFSGTMPILWTETEVCT